MRHDPIPAARADLIRRIDALAGHRGHVSVPRMQDEVDQIRHTARTFHFDALEGLAGTLQSALSLHGQEPIVLSYLDLMREMLARDAELDPGSGSSAASGSGRAPISCTPVVGMTSQVSLRD